MVRSAARNRTAGKTHSVSSRGVPGAKRRLPFSKSPVADNGCLRSASRATMATPQQLPAESCSGGRLFDSSFQAGHLMNSSFDSESNVLNSSRASVVSQAAAEKRDVAKTWIQSSCEAGDGFLYSEDIYERYKNDAGGSEMVLPGKTSCGFFAVFKQLFPFSMRKKKRQGGSRGWGYHGVRWRVGEVPVQSSDPEADAAFTAVDSVSTFSPSEADTLTGAPRPDSEFDFRKPLPIDFMKFHPKNPIPKEIVVQRNALPPYSLKPMYKQSPAERSTVDKARDALRHGTCGVCGKFQGSQLLVDEHQANNFDCCRYGLTCRLCNQKQRNARELRLHILSCDGQQRQSSPGVEDDLRDHPSLASVALSRATSDMHLAFRPTEQMKRFYSQNLDNDQRAATKGLHSQSLKTEWFNLPTSSTPESQIIPKPRQLSPAIEEKEKQAERAKPPFARLIRLNEQARFAQNGLQPSGFDVPRRDNIGQFSQMNNDDLVNDYISSLPTSFPPPAPISAEPLVSFTRKKKKLKERHIAAAGSKNVVLRPPTTPEIMALYCE